MNTKFVQLFMIILCVLTQGCSDLDKMNENDVTQKHMNTIILDENITEMARFFILGDSFLIIDNMECYLYGYQGELLKKFGSKGEGPGEFRFPFFAFVDEIEDNIVIYDIGKYSLDYFDLEGNYLNSKKISDIIKYYQYHKDYIVHSYRGIEENIIDKIEIIRDTTNLFYEKEYKSSDDVRNCKLDIDTTDDYIYILDVTDNEYSINCFDKNQNVIYVKKCKKKADEKIRLIAGKEMLLLSNRIENMENYSIIDLKGNLVGSFKMENDSEYIVDIYKGMLVKIVLSDKIQIEFLKLTF